MKKIYKFTDETKVVDGHTHRHMGVSGWAIIEPRTGMFYRGFYGEPGKFNITSSADDAYFAKTRKEAVEIAKHLGKGRKMTVAKMAVSCDINFQGATEVTGEDASRI